MYTKTKKLISTLLALALVLSLFVAMPVTALAANETVLAAGFNSIPGLTALADTTDHTVTVTGNLTTAVSTPLPIDSGVKIIWKANYTAASDDPLITINGSGTFEVVAGGTIANTGNGRAIQADGANTITVSGGTVSGKRVVIATIGANATVNVSGGSVTGTGNYNTIQASGNNATINVSGGSITGKGNILMSAAGGTVNVSGGKVSRKL